MQDYYVVLLVVSVCALTIAYFEEDDVDHKTMNAPTVEYNARPLPADTRLSKLTEEPDDAFDQCLNFTAAFLLLVWAGVMLLAGVTCIDCTVGGYVLFLGTALLFAALAVCFVHQLPSTV